MSLIRIGESSVSSSDDDNDTSSEGSGGTMDTRSSVLSLSLDEDVKNFTKYNIDNCTDFHVGPKLYAENCQITWNGESNLTPKNFMLENVETNSESSGGSASQSIISKWVPRRAHLYVVLLTIWLAIVTCVVIFVLGEEKVLKNVIPDNQSRTTPREYTTPQEYTTRHTEYATTPIFNSTTQQTIPPTTPPTPATTQLSTSAPSLTTLQPFPILISRDSWQGLQPPQNASRNRTQVRSVIVDNLNCDRCSGQVNCSKILRNLENATKTSLNFNFLIDDSGTMYEARGWNYASDEQTPFSVDIIKFGFIGNYGNSHLTEQQKEALSGFIAQYWKDFKTPPLVKAQCCRDIETEKGPDPFVTCDLYESMMFQVDTECISEVRNCDDRNLVVALLVDNGSDSAR
ncbi:hypothetical protein GE061_006276 [Apolygus lucorum]|uniref:Peptidoglycan recognition protein family domain-containing protein n=1 Tax=Apolygus lucorum TaxID=248454 RepID=A0A6A4JDY4_APOLU|nr:hypothetical protein GE061_006276 [Apolygus lucorum]